MDSVEYDTSHSPSSVHLSNASQKMFSSVFKTLILCTDPSDPAGAMQTIDVGEVDKMEQGLSPTCKQPKKELLRLVLTNML